VDKPGAKGGIPKARIGSALLRYVEQQNWRWSNHWQVMDGYPGRRRKWRDGILRQVFLPFSHIFIALLSGTRYSFECETQLADKGECPGFAILACAILYLVMFNRRNRLGIHDLVAQTYVAEHGAEISPVKSSTWKPRWIILASLVVLDFLLDRFLC